MREEEAAQEEEEEEEEEAVAMEIQEVIQPKQEESETKQKPEKQESEIHGPVDRGVGSNVPLEPVQQRWREDTRWK